VILNAAMVVVFALILWLGFPAVRTLE
jgi:hypothetical protein